MKGYTINGYRIEEEISRGSFSTIYGAVNVLTSANVCIKKMSKTKTTPKMFANEVTVMMQISNPLIVSMIEYFDDQNNYYIVLERVKGETLLSFINQTAENLSEWVLQRIFAQILAVIYYLHEKLCIVHRDLKLENIMLDEHFNIKLLDFGLSKINDSPNSLMNTQCGSYMYLAPEVLTGNVYTNTTDIWAIGCIFYCLATRKAPFFDKNFDKQCRNICFMEPEFPFNTNQDLQNLILLLLSKDPKKRPSAMQAFESKFFDPIRTQENVIAYFNNEYSWTRRVVESKNKEKIEEEIRKLGYSFSQTMLNIDNFDNKNAAVLRLLTISSEHTKEVVKPKKILEFPRRQRTQMFSRVTDKKNSILIVPCIKAKCAGRERHSLFTTRKELKIPAYDEIE